MATKKTRKPKARLDIGSDPPVVVGGGGSSFIWIKKDLEPQLVDPTGVPASAPQPTHPDQYYCLKITGNTGKIVLNDGNAPSGPGKSVNNKKYFVQFDL